MTKIFRNYNTLAEFNSEPIHLENKICFIKDKGVLYSNGVQYSPSKMDNISNIGDSDNIVDKFNELRKGLLESNLMAARTPHTIIYRLLVSISGNYNKDAFDTTDWTLTATVTAQYQEGFGPWTNTTTPSGISYSWSGASGSGSTATVGVSSVSMGSDGSHIGTKNVSVTVSLSGYFNGSTTVTVGRYGKSYYNA